MSGLEMITRTKNQMMAITGYAADTVSSVRRNDRGWHVTVELLELRCVPDSRDVLGTYEVTIDDNGNVLEYQRVRRYARGELEIITD